MPSAVELATTASDWRRISKPRMDLKSGSTRHTMRNRPSAASRETSRRPIRQGVTHFHAGDRLGVVSDSHGLLRPRVAELLQGVRAIIHAGDVGKISVLEELERIAPVHAVRGNVDRVPPCSDLPERILLQAGGQRILVAHILEEADVAGFDLVVCGHSHVPKISAVGSTCCLNPGSIGPRRFRLPVSMGYVTVSRDGALVPELRTIEIG